MGVEVAMGTSTYMVKHCRHTELKVCLHSTNEEMADLLSRVYKLPRLPR